MSTLHRVAAAALAGLIATLGLLVSPLGGALPPIVPPYVPVDLRWLVLPIAFAGLQGAAEHLAWPAPATTVLGAGLMAALAANVHASQVLSFLGVGWARPGPRIDLLALAAGIAVVCLGLWIAFDVAHERFRDQLVERGLDPGGLDGVSRRARAQARQALALAGLATAGLALAIRLLGRGLGGAAIPLPELGAILLVLAAGALLVGLPRIRPA